ncbi:MAG: TrkH family potassium uptake protein [Acidobacteriota bacterium]
MKHHVMLRVLGTLLLALAVTLLTPLLVSFLYHDGVHWSFLLSALAAGSAGGVLLCFFRGRGEIRLREGFAIVTVAWLAVASFGALPLWLSGAVPSFIDAGFESVSGFTTTGATVITDLDAIPKSILFWRAEMQWLGGMGIIVLSLAILPSLRVGGMQLFAAEMPGPQVDRLAPRIQDTAKALWAVYLLLTCAETLLLWVGEMTFFEAVCHAFTTVSTGGFSTSDASLGAFGSYAQVVVTVFMVLAGINFALHFSALREHSLRRYLQNQELKLFLGLFALGTIALVVANSGQEGSWLLRLRDGAFQVASLSTTTGFATTDYGAWPALSKCLLLILMLFGGCAGSTTGGVKLVRVLVAFKHALLQVRRLIHPREVKLLRQDHAVVPDDVSSSILGFIVLFVFLLLTGTCLVAATGVDLVPAATSVLACLGNVGPGLGEVGPVGNYAGVPVAAKLVLEACMVLGRLELFTIFVLFLPSCWRL